MRILGIHSLTHDSGVCLYDDGKVRYAVEEERLSRIKHHPGIEVEGKPPYLSLDWVLKEAGIKLQDIDKLVHVGWEGDSFMKLDIIRTRYRDFARSLDPDGKKTSFVSHHRAHAASAYYASGFDNALVLAIDGAGDWASTSIYLGEGRELEKVDEYPLDQSLGFMYSRAAKVLGLGDFGFGEGKMTALAAYGRLLNVTPIIKFENGRYAIDREYYNMFKKFRRDAGELTQEQKDFAYTVQTALEDTVIAILQSAYERYGKTRIALGGGIALNCRMNGKIGMLPWIEDLFIQPGANDSGLCLGAAYLGAIELNEPITRITTPYLGPGLDNNQVATFIQKNGLRGEKLADSSRTAAELLADGKTLAWMQGRAEFGPRALGHRSLLGDPRSIVVKDALNVIKQREYWRPVAPAMIASEKNYCTSNHTSEFMTKAVAMNELAVKDIPGALHVDNTARVQLVRDKSDKFYSLISNFEDITGIPAVLNTSLNARGEPICITIDEGVKFFFTTPTDYLIMEDWLVRK